MAFALPDLPYPPDALEPHIDAQTMKIHHGKHHNAYVTKLNDAIKGMPDLEAKPIEALIADLNSIPEKIRMAVKNGEWDKIPARYRELLQDYTKRMAEIESERKRD